MWKAKQECQQLVLCLWQEDKICSNVVQEKKKIINDNRSFPIHDRNYTVQENIHSKHTILATCDVMNFIQKKYNSIDTTIFVCSQMVQESLSLFMFLLQVKDKEETLEIPEQITDTVNIGVQSQYKYSTIYMSTET